VGAAAEVLSRAIPGAEATPESESRTDAATTGGAGDRSGRPQRRELATAAGDRGGASWRVKET
jgi:hypothetical protein